MDPLTIIVSALVSGASAGLSETVGTAIKDTYSALRKLVVEKYASVDVAQLEKDPKSSVRRSLLAEEIKQHPEIGDDEEIRALADDVLKKLENLAPSAAAAIGVDIDKLKARNLTIEDVVSSGTGVTIRDTQIEGDATLKGIRAGVGSGNPGKA